jgi:hypothetical protein
MSGDNEGEPYEIGYRKPPKATRFKTGQSGNPKGRKPKSVTVHKMLREKLQRKIKMSDGTTTQVLDLIISRGLQEIAAGRVGKWAQTFEFLARFDPQEKFVPSAGDEERLEQLIAEMNGVKKDDE